MITTYKNDCSFLNFIRVRDGIMIFHAPAPPDEKARRQV